MARDNDTVALRGRMVGLMEAGLGIRETARHLGVAPSTVMRGRDPHQMGQPLTDQPRSSRPRCTTIEQDLAIVNTAVIDPMTKRGATGITDEVSKQCFVLSDARSNSSWRLACECCLLNTGFFFLIKQ